MIQEIRSILMQVAKRTWAALNYTHLVLTRPNTRPNDIDILVIYDHAEQPKLLRRLLENLLYIRVDLIFMAKDEENETDFIPSQSCCLPIFQQ